MSTARTRFVKTSFQSGLISHKAYWRSDGEAFHSACRELENFRVGNFGEIERRNGVRFVRAEDYSSPQISATGKLYGFSLLDVDTSGTDSRLPLLMTVVDTGMTTYPTKKLRLFYANAVKTAKRVVSSASPALVNGDDFHDDTFAIGEKPLRHASHEGVEYFVGEDTMPFKVYLKGNEVYAEHLDFMVEPMNDTEQLSEYTWTVEDSESEDEVVVVSADCPYLKYFYGGMSVMLVNYLESATVSVYAKYDGSNSGKKAGYTSDVIPVMGSVTLKTEAGYWAGSVSLYERQREYGGSEDEYTDVCLGTIVSGGMLGSASLPCTITRMNSEVYFKIDKLTNAATTLNMDGYKDQGTTISLVISGTQEVYLKFKILVEDNTGSGGLATAKFKKVSRISTGFTTTSYGLSAFFSMVGDGTLYLQVGSYLNMPKTICFFQDRMVLGSNRTHPKTIWMSRTGDLSSFQLGTDDDYAITTVVSGSDEEEICWLSPRDALVIGTTAREYALRGSTTAAITPTSIKVSKPSGDSAYGSVYAESFNSDEGLYCLRSGGKKLLRYQYSSDTYTYVPVEVNPLNPEIFGEGDGAISFCVANRPDQTFYVVRQDGKVAVCNYLQHGGNGGGSWSVYDFGKNPVDDICTVRNKSGTKDDVFFLVYWQTGGTKAGFAIGYLTDDDYTDSIWVNNVKTDVGFTSRMKCTPWLISDGDAWGRRISIQTTELCMNEGRAFRVSYDDGATWIDENRVFRESDGAQREIVDGVVECTSPADWRDEASMVIETDDNHQFVLNAIRARLTIGDF